MGILNFIETVTASDLRDSLKDKLSLVKGDQVLQIVHRGQPVRVLMTQDHYLNLLAKIDMLSNEKPRTRDRETVENRMRKLGEKLDATEENGVNSSSIRGAG